MQDAETLWADFARPIATADDYIASLRGRRMSVFIMGERVDEPVDHPVIRPSINAMAETYRLASERPELAAVRTDMGDYQVNRFLRQHSLSGSATAVQQEHRRFRPREGGARVSNGLVLVQRAPAGIGGAPSHDPAPGSRTGGNRRSIFARLGSSQGGSLSDVPRRSAASSTANPGGSVAISNKIPPGSRK